MICAGFKFKPLHLILIKFNRRNKSVTKVSTQFQKNVFFNTKFTVSLKLKIHLIFIICMHVCNMHLHACVTCVYRQKDRETERQRKRQRRETEIRSFLFLLFIYLVVLGLGWGTSESLWSSLWHVEYSAVASGIWSPGVCARARCIESRESAAGPPGKTHSVAAVQSVSHVPLFVTPWTAAARLLCPPLSPGVCSNSCPLSQWNYPIISSSAAPFFGHQSFPALGLFH